MIRTANENDAKAVFDIINDLEDGTLGYEVFSGVFLQQLQNYLYVCIVYEDEGEIKGVLNLRLERQLHHTGKIAEIMEFAVRKDSRNRGIGEQLLAFAETTARNQGCEQIEVACSQARKEAHRFYLREGMINTHFRFVKRFW